MTRARRFAGVLFLAAFAAGAAAPHRHPRFEDGGDPRAVEGSHDHVLSRHNPLSRATHFHAILGVEHDACAACHGVRSLARPAPAAPLHSFASAERVLLRPSQSVFDAAPRSASSRAPPASA